MEEETFTEISVNDWSRSWFVEMMLENSHLKSGNELSRLLVACFFFCARSFKRMRNLLQAPPPLLVLAPYLLHL